jgi:hypothetical protein
MAEKLAAEVAETVVAIEVAETVVATEVGAISIIWHKGKEE